MADVCGEVIEGRDEFGRTEPSLHGVYHASVEGDEFAKLEVRVHTASDHAHPEIRTRAEAAYRAVTEAETGARVYVPAILATRDARNFWDTEIIVQNVADMPINVIVELCDDGGQCFSNNEARFGSHERRIFLASHLLYEPSPDGLAERSGWYAATVRAAPVDTASGEARIAVTTNFFRQSVAADRVRPQAEYGSMCQHGETPLAPSMHIKYQTDIPGTTWLRMHNPRNKTTDVRIAVLSQPGTEPIVRQFRLAPRASQTIGIPYRDLQPASVASINEVAGVNFELGVGRQILVDTSSPIAAFAWNNLGPLDAGVNLETPRGMLRYSALRSFLFDGMCNGRQMTIWCLAPTSDCLTRDPSRMLSDRTGRGASTGMMRATVPSATTDAIATNPTTTSLQCLTTSHYGEDWDPAALPIRTIERV